MCKFKNWALRALKVITFSPEKTAFQWSKVVSETIFPTNLGVCLYSEVVLAKTESVLIFVKEKLAVSSLNFNLKTQS